MRAPAAPRHMGFDKTLLFASLCLVAVGILMVFSASGFIAGDKYKQSLYYLLQHLAGAGVGVAIAVLILWIRKPLFESPVVVYGLLAASGFLLALCFVMPTIARTNRWIVLSGFRFQPSELAKISLVLFLAYFCETRRDRLDDLRTLWFPLGVAGAAALLILMEPNFSTAVIVSAVSALVLFLGGVKLRYLFAVALVALLVFGAFLSRTDYTMDRIRGFLDPGGDPQGGSFQVTQSKLAVGSGGIVGKNLGQSTQKLYFLPYAHTDFIFAIIGEETGLLGALFTLGLFCLFLWRGVVIALRAPTASQKLVAAGLTALITAQALLNITVVLGIGPVTGIPLPFISYGRSSLVCSLASVGILLRISRRRVETGARI
jgi:cell division protein FtsW